MAGAVAARRRREGAGSNPRSEDFSTYCRHILERVHSSKKVTEEDIRQLYNLNKPVCQGCRVNTKDSCNCFCGLIPPVNGVRKQGLWQKVPGKLADLGVDPNEALRSSLEAPSGLTNLGATCYVNSVLQCLYMNKKFRRGLFGVEMDLIQDQPILYQLVLLFAQLHSGKKVEVDSAPFASTLELNNAVQQDGHEFLKLLLTLLERLLGLSKSAESKTLVQDTFRGTLNNVIRCSKCGKESEASRQPVFFYELELNVKDLMGLEESLDEHLTDVQLQGDNLYLCESCNMLVEATYCTKLRSVPPVLNFHLKRFVFNAKTGATKKVSSKFSFPQSLDMTSRISLDGTDLLSAGNKHRIYDLSAILIHKGSTTSSGHYVSHVRDVCTGQWWEFDDESVRSLGQNPLGDSSSLGTVKKKPTCKETEAEIHFKEDSPLLSDAKLLGEVKADGLLTSADAYMLMYCCRDDTTSAPNIATDDNKSVWADSLLPEELRFEIGELNAEFERSCLQYNQRKEDELSKIKARRNEVRSILSEAPVQAQSDDYFWISSDWLRSWADSLDPPSAIENTSLLCTHLKAPFKNVSLMKRISEVAWKKLYEKYGGGPVLSSRDSCPDCIIEEANAIASANSFRDQRIHIKEILEDFQAKSNSSGNLFFVSKTWLTSWLRRKSADAPSEADVGPTAALTCSHGGLLPDKAPGAKRQLVPQLVWDYFHHISMRIEGDCPTTSSCFPLGSETCAICEVEMTQDALHQEDLIAIKSEQRQRHELLYNGRGIAISLEKAYYLIPSTWISRWRSYLGVSKKSVSTVEEPNGLDEAICSTICSKHGGLLFRPPVLCRTKNGDIIQRDMNDDVLTIVSEDDWKVFCEHWGGDQCMHVKAYVQLAILPATSETGCDKPIIPEEDGLEVMLAVPSLRTEPEVCKECVEERESVELMNRLQYREKEIFVDLVRGKEPPKSLLTSTNVTSDSERRTSKRARRCSSSTRGTFTVSGDTTVHQLKLQIWEYFMVVKENQKVHFGQLELTEDSATLADLSIFPGAHLWVVDTGVHENRDIAEELFEEIEYGRAEEGFSGTLLASLPGHFESAPMEVT